MGLHGLRLRQLPISSPLRLKPCLRHLYWRFTAVDIVPLCTESALALDPPCADQSYEDLLMPFLHMWDFRTLNLLCIQCCLSVSSLRVQPDLDCVNFPYLVFWDSKHVLNSCTESYLCWRRFPTCTYCWLVSK